MGVAASDGADILTIRPMSSCAEYEEGATAVQGSRLHFVSPLGRDTNAGGKLYGPGSFGTAEELRDFLINAEIDVSAWNQGEGKGLHGLLRELETLECTLEVEDRRLIRCEHTVRVRVQRPGSKQYLKETRVIDEKLELPGVLGLGGPEAPAPTHALLSDKKNKIELWKSTTAKIFSTTGTMLAGTVVTGQDPADVAIRLAKEFAGHVVDTLKPGGVDPSSVAISYESKSGFMRALATQLKKDDATDVQMLGATQEVEEYALTKSFPGLATRRKFHEFAINVPGVPGTNFTSKTGLGGTEVTHHWEWQMVNVRTVGLTLTPTQTWLLEAVFAGCSTVEVSKLHPFQDAHSESLLLRTRSYDISGAPDEPTITKIDSARAIAEEVEKTSFVLERGIDALRPVRPPLFVSKESKDVLLGMDYKVDQPLRDRLQEGTIRLLRCSWLISTEADSSLNIDLATGAAIMARRKDLPREAFYTREEAVLLLDRGDRSIFALSQCWQTTEHPDPHGMTLLTLRQYLRSEPRAGECGLYWDWTSMDEDSFSWRTEDLEHKLTMPFFASITGTTVLQIKDVPPRPAQYDGLVMLFGVPKDTTEDDLAADAAEFGEVIECEISGDKGAVNFRLHSEAAEMVQQYALRRFFGKEKDKYKQIACHFAYDERPYEGADSRGWPGFEQAVCLAVATQLAWCEAKGQMPQRFKLAQQTRPKVVDISGNIARHPCSLNSPRKLLADAMTSMEEAKFTVNSDQDAAVAQLDAFRALMYDDVKPPGLEDMGVIVLEMGEACWALPEYCTRLDEPGLISTLKEHITRQLSGVVDAGKDKLPIVALRDLWGPGGPLNCMAYKSMKRGQLSAIERGGLIDSTLFSIIDSLLSALCVPQSSWLEHVLDKARDAGFTPSPPVQYTSLNKCVMKLLAGGQYAWIEEVHAAADTHAERFQHSFALEPIDDLWADLAGGEPLVEVLRTLERAMQGGELRGLNCLDKPTLLAYAHKNCNLENIIVDAAGSLWLSNFVNSGFSGIFEDAVKVISELLFESFPVPFVLAEVKSANVERLAFLFQLSDEAAERLKKGAEECASADELLGKFEGDAQLTNAMARIAGDDLAAERMSQACAVLEAFLAPIFANASDVKRVPTLAQLCHCKPPKSWPAHSQLMLKLITTITQFSYELCVTCSQREQAQSTGDEAAPYLESDLHTANFILPLLRLALQSLTDQTLSMWQKRFAWRASQMLASASCEVMRRPSTSPPKYKHRSKNLKLSDGQLISLRTSESRFDGGAGTSIPMIVGERGNLAPTYDSCSHIVLPWSFQPKGGAASAVIESGALHDYKVELPILSAIIKGVPVPPAPVLCLPFDVPVPQMTRITDDILAVLTQVLSTCRTPAIRIEVKRAQADVQGLWRKRCEQRTEYERKMAIEVQMGTHLVAEINMIQGDRWRMEAQQKIREADIMKNKEKAVERFIMEKAVIDQSIALERRKIMKMKHRLLMIKESTRRRIQEQQAAERDADAQAAKAMTARLSSTRDETLEEQANRERAEGNLRTRRKAEDSKRQRLAEEELQEKSHILKKEGDARRGLMVLQQQCAQVDRCLGAARELEDKVRVVDGQKVIEPAWLAVDIEAAVQAIRSVTKSDMTGKTADQKFDEIVKGELEAFSKRHTRVVAVLRKETLEHMEEDAQNKTKEERTKKDPFIDSIIDVRFQMDEYDMVNIAIENALDKEVSAKKRQTTVAADEANLRKVEMAHQVLYCTRLAEIVRFEQTEANVLSWTTEAISKAGTLGARDYAEGQQLIVHCADGVWRDAVVVDPPSPDGDISHLLLVDSDEDVWEDGDSFGTETRITLYPFNHAPRELSIAHFDIIRARWTRTMRSQHATLVDPLTGVRHDVTKLGVRLKKLKHTVVKSLTSLIGSKAQGELRCPLDDEGDAESFTEWLQRAHSLRCNGDATFKASLMLTGAPASGKSCLLKQIVIHLIDGNERLDGNLIPIHIRAHELQSRLLNEDGHIFGQAWNWIDAYMKIVHGHDSETYSMLRQALMSRRALVLIDGIDECGVVRERIVRHITEILAPQGHMVVITSRPTREPIKAFGEFFHHLELQPLSDEQQHELIASRMNKTETIKLNNWIRNKMPLEPTQGDQDVKRRLTASPLMLEFLISLHDHRHLVGSTQMPLTVVEMYEMACNVMLSRVERTESGAIAAKVAEPHVSRLLEAIFLETHNARVRVIEEEHLLMAALSLVAPQQLKAIQAREKVESRKAALRISCRHLPPEVANALRIVRERMLQDRLPVMRLLQAEPLQVISHLTFQEYYAARAICRGRPLHELPWEWSAWWGNVLKLGLEMGDQFGTGLLRASGITESHLDLHGVLPRGDRSLSMDAIVAIVQAKDTPLSSLDISGNRLEESEMLIIGNAMLGNHKSQITAVTADQFSLKVDDTALDVSRMRIRPEGFVLLAGAIRANTTLTALNASSNYMVQWAGHQRNKIVPVQLCGVAAMAQAISDKMRTQGLCALQHLNLSTNALGAEGAVALSPILLNYELKSLSLRDNKLGDVGVEALVDGLKQSHLTALDLSKNGIRVEGVRVLAGAMRRMRALRELDLSSNHVVGNGPIDALSLEGLQALAKAVGVSGLKALDLSATQLCGVWDDAETGKHGEVKGRFEIGGVHAVAEALAACASLTALTLLHNKIHISPDAAKAIEAANKRRGTPAAVSYR